MIVKGSGGHPGTVTSILRISETAFPRREPLMRAYEAMAEPRVVFAVGACAISGSLLGKAVSDTLRIDVTVPGCPPDPFTIMDAVQKARGVK